MQRRNLPRLALGFFLTTSALADCPTCVLPAQPVRAIVQASLAARSGEGGQCLSRSQLDNNGRPTAVMRGMLYADTIANQHRAYDLLIEQAGSLAESMGHDRDDLLTASSCQLDNVLGSFRESAHTADPQCAATIRSNVEAMRAAAGAMGDAALGAARIRRLIENPLDNVSEIESRLIDVDGVPDVSCVTAVQAGMISLTGLDLDEHGTASSSGPIGGLNGVGRGRIPPRDEKIRDDLEPLLREEVTAASPVHTLGTNASGVPIQVATIGLGPSFSSVINRIDREGCSQEILDQSFRTLSQMQFNGVPILETASPLGHRVLRMLVEDSPAADSGGRRIEPCEVFKDITRELRALVQGFVDATRIPLGQRPATYRTILNAFDGKVRNGAKRIGRTRLREALARECTKLRDSSHELACSVSAEDLAANNTIIEGALQNSSLSCVPSGRTGSINIGLGQPQHTLPRFGSPNFVRAIKVTGLLGNSNRQVDTRTRDMGKRLCGNFTQWRRQCAQNGCTNEVCNVDRFCDDNSSDSYCQMRLQVQGALSNTQLAANQRQESIVSYAQSSRDSGSAFDSIFFTSSSPAFRGRTNVFAGRSTSGATAVTTDTSAATAVASKAATPATVAPQVSFAPTTAATNAAAANATAETGVRTNDGSAEAVTAAAADAEDRATRERIAQLEGRLAELTTKMRAEASRPVPSENAAAEAPAPMPGDTRAPTRAPASAAETEDVATSARPAFAARASASLTPAPTAVPSPQAAAAAPPSVGYNVASAIEADAPGYAQYANAVQAAGARSINMTPLRAVSAAGVALVSESGQAQNFVELPAPPEGLTVQQVSEYIRQRMGEELRSNGGRPMIVQLGNNGPLWKVEFGDQGIRVSAVTQDQVQAMTATVRENRARYQAFRQILSESTSN